jgi:hypothetical protein
MAYNSDANHRLQLFLGIDNAIESLLQPIRIEETVSQSEVFTVVLNR